MAITLSTPLTVPETVYDKVWISELVINAPKPTEPVNIAFWAIPYNGATGDLKLDAAKQATIGDFFTVAQERAGEGKPKMLLAFGALIDALDEWGKEQGLY